MQMEAGALGITCQKLGEVEVFVDAGVADDVLLTYNILGRQKTDRLMGLIKRVRRLTVVLDNEVVARELSEAARAAGVDVRFLVECDTGFGRTGVQTPDEAFDLARTVARLPRMQFEGS
jgi:D-serine deaminase-like pyridoxal phosphate-dependent protein